MSNGQHIWFDEPTWKRDDYLHKQKMDLKRVSWSEAKHNDIENCEWAICPFCRCSLCCHTHYVLLGKTWLWFVATLAEPSISSNPSKRIL
ncbi:hypothetical protein ACFX15_029774 [Malus domestica]